MRHPTEGTLRRLLDEPAAVADADRAHAADCPVCLAELAAAREDAALVATALAVPALDAAGAPDAEAGWRRLSQAAAADGRPRPAVTGVRPRRLSLRRPAIGVAAVAAVLLAGGTAAAAADWLPIFRTERISPLAISDADLLALPDLSAYGDLETSGEVDPHPVDGAAAAAKATGLAVPKVAQLPRGVTGSPTYEVGGRVTATFTFSATKAARAAVKAGAALPTPPPGMDGARFRLAAGPGVAEVWSESRGVPAMIVARAVAPTGYSSGVPFATARDYLLSLPGLPPNVASQLRTFSGDGTTLPLPLPSDQLTTTPTDVHGVPATVLTAKSGLLTGVVWVDKGVLTAVAGSLGSDEVLAVARGLDQG